MVSAPAPASRGGTRRSSTGAGGKPAGRAGGVGGNVGGGVSNNSKCKDKEVGHFVLGKTMGEGTFGEVKLALHKPTSERVAAKVHA